MKVKILVSFVDTLNGEKYRMREGDEVELPAGANWLEVGFAVEMAPKVVTKRSRKKAVSEDGS